MSQDPELFDVAVIGAGPAGSLSSYYLSKAGLSVLLIEKESLPRYKTCGGGLVFRARKIIPEFQENVVERECFEIDWGIQKDNLHFKVTRPYPIITMVMRDKFDKALVDNSIQQGTVFKDHTLLKSISFNGMATLHTSKGTFSAKILIGADGALSTTAKLGGINDPRYLIPALEAEVHVNQEQFDEFSNMVRFDVDALPAGYGWVFPKKRHLSIGIASENRGNIKLRQAYINYMQYLGITDILNEEIHGFQIPISTRKVYAGNRILLTGDAAGLADPLVAEGISHALISGKLAAESIIEANLDWINVEKLYLKKLQQSVLLQTRTGQFLSRLFYHYPRLRNYVLKRKGQRLTEYFTDVFCGIRRYPERFTDISRAVLKALY